MPGSVWSIGDVCSRCDEVAARRGRPARSVDDRLAVDEERLATLGRGVGAATAGSSPGTGRRRRSRRCAAAAAWCGRSTAACGRGRHRCAPRDGSGACSTSSPKTAWAASTASIGRRAPPGEDRRAVALDERAHVARVAGTGGCLSEGEHASTPVTAQREPVGSIRTTACVARTSPARCDSVSGSRRHGPVASPPCRRTPRSDSGCWSSSPATASSTASPTSRCVASAQAVGSNNRMLLYYFGSKEEMISAALITASQRFPELQKAFELLEPTGAAAGPTARRRLAVDLGRREPAVHPPVLRGRSGSPSTSRGASTTSSVASATTGPSASPSCCARRASDRPRPAAPGREVVALWRGLQLDLLSSASTGDRDVDRTPRRRPPGASPRSLTPP